MSDKPNFTMTKILHTSGERLRRKMEQAEEDRRWKARVDYEAAQARELEDYKLQKAREAAAADAPAIKPILWHGSLEELAKMYYAEWKKRIHAATRDDLWREVAPHYHMVLKKPRGKVVPVTYASLAAAARKGYPPEPE